MPCYDSRDHEPRTEVKYIKGLSPDEVNKKLFKLKDKVAKLEAGLCAVINELEKKGIANEILSQASKSGLIDLMEFWEKHSKEDEARLAKKFHEFSEHEQDLIRKMISDNKL
jgi:hypothetical protein